jgi:hypothetical protein
VRFALGDFTASYVVGPTILNSRAKDVQISDFTNSLEVSIVRGDIELRPGRVPLSRIDASTRSGDVELSIPMNAKFDLNASTTRGDVTNDYGSPLRTESENHGAAAIRGSVSGGPSVNVHTERGQVVVRKASADDKPMTPKTEVQTQTPMPPTPLKKVEQ